MKHWVIIRSVTAEIPNTPHKEKYQTTQMLIKLCVYININFDWIYKYLSNQPSNEWISMSVCTNDPHETTSSESSVIQYAMELRVTCVWLACTAISIDWAAPPWITKTSMLRHDSPQNPFNCLPWSNISQCMRWLITKKDYTWLTKYSLHPIRWHRRREMNVWIIVIWEARRPCIAKKFEVALVHLIVSTGVHYSFFCTWL